jgi:hypothetical protein
MILSPTSFALSFDDHDTKVMVTSTKTHDDDGAAKDSSNNETNCTRIFELIEVEGKEMSMQVVGTVCDMVIDQVQPLHNSTVLTRTRALQVRYQLWAPDGDTMCHYATLKGGHPQRPLEFDAVHALSESSTYGALVLLSNRSGEVVGGEWRTEAILKPVPTSEQVSDTCTGSENEGCGSVLLTEAADTDGKADGKKDSSVKAMVREPVAYARVVLDDYLVIIGSITGTPQLIDLKDVYKQHVFNTKDGEIEDSVD